MLFGIAKYIYSRLPYAKYTDTRTEGGVTETPRNGETGETSETSTESKSTLKIGEEVKLDGVVELEPSTARCVPNPNSPRLPTKTSTRHYTVAPNTTSIIGYNERTGATVVQDSNGNLITVTTAGNPFLNHGKAR